MNENESERLAGRSFGASISSENYIDQRSPKSL